MSKNSFGNIKLELENNIATIIIDRPEKMNALNTTTLKEMSNALDQVEMENTKCLIITGAGKKAFAAGADIKEMADASSKEALEYSRLGHGLYQRLEKISIPTIAAINGYALGGGNELGLSCDIRIAAENAVFGQPETNLGIIPGWGGTQRLTREIGQANAMNMILVGDRLSAEEALRIGLVSEVVSKEKLMEKAREKAQTIAEKSNIPIKKAKNLIRLCRETNLQTGLEMEIETFSNLFNTYDQKEGMEAFLNNRDPDFRDK